jgi:hypothetical protein
MRLKRFVAGLKRGKTSSVRLEQPRTDADTEAARSLITDMNQMGSIR